MTREEIAEFVRKVISTNSTAMEAAGIIAAAWEEDKQIASDESFTRGQHSMHPF